jgi:hypothetical protein
MSSSPKLFGFDVLSDDERFGILPKGRILRSPCQKFYLQLIEPEPGIVDVEGDESLSRVGLGTSDVVAAVKTLLHGGIIGKFRRDGRPHAQLGPSQRLGLAIVATGAVHWSLDPTYSEGASAVSHRYSEGSRSPRL